MNRKSQVRKLALFLILGITMFSIVYFAGFTMAIFGEDPTSGGAYSLTAPSEYSFDEINEILTDSNGLQYKADGEKLRILLDNRTLKFEVKSQDYDYSMAPTDSLSHVNGNDKHSIEYKKNDNSLDILQNVTFFQHKDRKMKIEHKLKNNGPQIKKVKFYYVFSVEPTDDIEIDGQTCTGLGVCVNDSNVDRPNTINFNDEYDFKYQDLIENDYQYQGSEFKDGELILKFKHKDKDNLESGEELLLDPSFSSNDIDQIAASALSQNTFILTWCDETTDLITYQTYYANGTSITEPLMAYDVLACYATTSMLDVEALNSTTFAINYLDANLDDILAGVFDISGNNISGVISLDSPQTSFQRNSIAAINSTRFVSAWTKTQNGDIILQLHNVDGTNATDPMTITTTDNDGVSVTALNDTSFVLLWSDNGPAMRFNVFDLDGNSDWLNTTIYARAGSEFDSAAFNDTAFVFAFRDNLPGNSWNYTVMGTDGTIYSNGLLIGSGDSNNPVGALDSINSTAFSIIHRNASDHFTLDIFDIAGNSLIDQILVSKAKFHIDVALTSGSLGNNISLFGDNFIIAYTNDTGSFWEAYQSDGTVWDGVIDELILRTPSSNDEVLNTLDDTLNVSINNFQAAQIWYTIDESETNTTICLDASATCDDNETTITYPNQGYFNLTVYANKSDGTEFSATSTDILVGNQTDFYVTEDLYVTGTGTTRLSLAKYNISNNGLSSSIIINATAHFYRDNVNYDNSDRDINVTYINNQTWTEDMDPVGIGGCTEFNALASSNSSEVFWNDTSASADDTWANFNVLEQFLQSLGNSDNNFSIKFSDPDYSFACTISAADGVVDGDGMRLAGPVGGQIPVMDIEDREGSLGNAGNMSFVRVVYYSENSAPSTPTLETPADASTTGGNASIFFNWTSTDPDNDTLTYYLYLEYEDSTPDDIINVTYNAISGNYNTVNWTNATDGFIDGTYYWKVIAHDSTNDNVTSGVNSFQISTSVPSVNLQHPANNQWFKESTVNFNFTATDDNLQTCELWGNWTDGWHNNFSWVLPNSGVQNFTNVEIADGWYKWNIRCNNTGNTYGWGLNRTFGVDTVLPVINITYPFNSSNVADENLGVNFTIIETNLFSVWWSRLTSLVNNTIAKGLNITGQVWNYGWNNVTVYANDSAGNENSSRVSFFLNQPLTINLVSPVDEANLTGLSKTFVASASDGDTLDNITHYIWYSNSTLYTTNYSNINEDDNTSAWSYTFEEYNDYLWNVRVCDIFNNCNFSDSNYTLRIYEDEFSIDTLTSTQNTLALTTVLQATTTKPENNELVWFNFTLEKQNGEVILSSENGTHYNGQQNINSTTSPLLNSTGIYNVTALLRDRFGTLIQFNSTFQVNYSLSISPSNTTFVATQAKNETNTFQVTLFDDTQGNITYTLTVAIDDPNNFTTSMTPSTILLNHSDSISAPLQSLFSVNASNQVDNGTYTGNITISNSTYGIEELVFFAYGINPPGGIPRLFFTNGTACNTSATVCDESLSIKRATTYNVIRRVKNTGYFDMTSCSPKLQNTSGTQYTLEDAGWVTMTPTSFNLAQNATQDITITISPGAGLLTTENYEGSFFVRCENADLIGNSQDAPTEDWPFISVSIFEGVVPGGSGGSGGAVPFSVVNVSQEVEEALAGFCGNKICELDAGENFLQCQEDCAGDLTLLSDCVGFDPDEWGPNCIFRSTDALIWIFAVMVAVIVFALLFEVEPKRGGGSKLVFQPVGTKRRRRR